MILFAFDVSTVSWRIFANNKEQVARLSILGIKFSEKLSITLENDATSDSNSSFEMKVSTVKQNNIINEKLYKIPVIFDLYFDSLAMC